MCLSFRNEFKAPSSQCQRPFTMGSDTKANGDPYLSVKGTTAVEMTDHCQEPIRL